MPLPDDDISGLMGGNFMAAVDLPLGQRFQATIVKATKEEVGQDNKVKAVLVLHSLQGDPWPKPIILNKTALADLAPTFGKYLRAWIGQSIEVWTATVRYGTKLVPGFKFAPMASPQAVSSPVPTTTLRPPQTPPAAAGAVPGAQSLAGNGSVLPAATTRPFALVPQATTPASAADLDDEIPF